MIAFCHIMRKLKFCLFLALLNEPVISNELQFIFHKMFFNGLLLKPIFRFHFDNAANT
jgi:hypothetical protein